MMVVQTATAPISVSAYGGTPLHNLISQRVPFLFTENLIPVVGQFTYCCYRSQSVLSCKSRNRLRAACCLPRSTPSNEGQDPRQSVRDDSTEDRGFPKTIPRKPRRGRKSEAAAVEDFIRNSLEQTFASIRETSLEVPENMENVMKDGVDEENGSDASEDEDKSDDVGKRGKKMMVDEESKSWPLDADVGWGIRASEYFDQHSIRNTVGEDGVEIDWEGEIDEGWVKEINCLEWEDFAFHPSPLIVLVFERYHRASDNWKALRELENAAKVYWEAENCLPPRTVKIDINIEKDLAYALKVKEGPELLFLRGNRILYREKNIRTSDELVQMIAHFYYKAKKPAWIR
uniref:Thioredoxin-like protein n=1 Tax=Kalanchoe fedtschenkoi TaxID=63787 RepID=A0A7N0ZTI8_KALFE